MMSLIDVCVLLTCSLADREEAQEGGRYVRQENGGAAEGGTGILVAKLSETGRDSSNFSGFLIFHVSVPFLPCVVSDPGAHPLLLDYHQIAAAMQQFLAECQFEHDHSVQTSNDMEVCKFCPMWPRLTVH